MFEVNLFKNYVQTILNKAIKFRTIKLMKLRKF